MKTTIHDDTEAERIRAERVAAVIASKAPRTILNRLCSRCGGRNPYHRSTRYCVPCQHILATRGDKK